MSEKRFDIVVQDKVARTIKTELASIGTTARMAATDLNTLYAAMGTRASTAATAAQTAATRTAAATARVTAETERSAAAQARVAASYAKAGIAEERLAQAKLKTATMQSRANIAAIQEEAALNRVTAAEAKATAQTEQLAKATNDLAAAGKRATIIHDPVTVPQATNSRLGGPVGSRSQEAASTGMMMRATPLLLDDPVVPAATVANLKNVATASTAAAIGIKQVGAMSNNARIAMLDMTHVGINMGTMLATGVSPMRALLMESGRLATAVQYSGGSIKNLISATASWIGITQRTSDAVKDAAAAQAAAVAANIASANASAVANARAAESEIAIATAQQAAATTATEAAAAEERLAVADAQLAAANTEAAVTAAALAEANQAVATTAREAAAAEAVALAPLGVALAVVATALGSFLALLGALDHQANENSGLKHYTKEMGYTASEVKKLNSVTVTWGDTAKAVFQVGLERIASALGISTANMKKKWGDFLDFMASKTRATLAGVYAGFMTLAKLSNPITAGMINPLEDLKKNYADAQKFFDDVVKQARTNAQDRQNQMAKDFHDDKKQPKGPKGWDRAKEWRDANAELDVTIKNLGLYGDALERAQQIEQIGRTFREHGKPLTAAEVKILDDKIKKIQEGTRVQEAMTAADEAANGPERTLAATQEALNKLYADGKINAEQYTDQMNLATRAYDDAVDPLAALNRELQENQRLMGLYGKDKSLAEYLKTLESAAKAHGSSIYERPLGPQAPNTIVGGRQKLTPEAQGMVDQYKQQQRQGELDSKFEDIDPRVQRQQESTSNFILDNYREMYKNIQDLRDQDVISEQEAGERKKNLDQALGMARLEAASTVFGKLAGLQNSKNRELAAIGKAAAITQATIDGIVAVQAALKGPPGPPWSFAIAAATGVMTAANIAKIAGIKGFAVGGYTGNGGRSQPAGVVHGQEYVVRAPYAAQNRSLLEAINSGADPATASSTTSEAKTVTAMADSNDSGYLSRIATATERLVKLAEEEKSRGKTKSILGAVSGFLTGGIVGAIAGFAGSGHKNGGWTGSGGINEPAGMVHGQEYVFDAASTRRIGVPALDAMRSGARLNGGPASNDNGGRGVTVHQYPGVAIEVRERSDGEIEIIAERAARRVAPHAVATDMANPNSRTSKAVTTHFKTQRNRA